MEISENDLRLLISLLPDWAKDDVPKGLEPTCYGTLTYEGDLWIQSKVDRIIKNFNKYSGD